MAQGLSTLKDDDLILNDCVQAFTSFVCATTFPMCITDTSLEVKIIPPCKSTCTNVIKSCLTNPESASTETQEIIKKYILSSKFFPQDCCNNITTSPPLNFEYPIEKCNSSPQLFNRPKCFKPLIEDRKWIETNKSEVTSKEFCQNGCCLPCPQSYALYPSNQMERGFLVTQILRVISVIGSGIMLFSYIVLPEKRAHPNLLILFASFSIFLYSTNVFFSILKPKRVQCINEIIPSTQGNNPFFCGFQGALLIFASYATIIWIGFIILNFHVHTVWNSNIMDDKYIYLHIVGWGIPTLFTIIALITHSINYQFATLCFIKVETSNSIFFYPLAAIIIPIFFIHIWTFGYIYRIMRKDRSNAEFKTRVLQPITIQWRELLLSVILIISVIFYWLFYFIKLSTIVKIIESKGFSKFLKDWMICIQSGKGQNYCANNVENNFMPSFRSILAAEISVSLIGVYFFIIFYNEILWLELNQWIHEKSSTIRSYD
ncbi:hypothetical protein C1645_790717 [Glomus cerebriforme]|uniref:G-protein coupled receptors family 2 profile 2 domain-containing protein n=1 Tax=Glomus cerebriforme TaxID=658196 RepID=A0A397S714_9GLOM|nr:hypothetical protein C1645_790717 [Glomus cerebriforme]